MTQFIGFSLRSKREKCSQTKMKIIKADNMAKQIVLLFVFLQYISADPLSHKKCSIQDSDCLKREAQAALKTFVQGIPELGIKKLDKLHLGDTDVKTEDVEYRLFNTEIAGFNNTIIDELSIHLPFKRMRLNFHTTLAVDCDYKIDGKFFELPVTGEGKAVAILKNLQMEMLMTFDIIKNEQGKDVMHLKNFYYGADSIDGSYFKFENLYYGDKNKSDAFHELVNISWRTVLANFGRYFTANVMKDIFEAIQIYMRSRPLEDFVQY